MNSTSKNSQGHAGLSPHTYVASEAPRFALGQVVSTPGALQLMQDSHVDPMSLVRLHERGCWGTIPAQDAQSNEEALECGARVMSSYLMPSGGVIWIITEADRSVTTCLRPDEY